MARITKIVWDFDDWDCCEQDLPQSVNLQEDIPKEDIADYLLKEFGRFVKSFVVRA